MSDENVTHGLPPNLLTQDEIRRIRAALDRMEAPKLPVILDLAPVVEKHIGRWIPPKRHAANRDGYVASHPVRATVERVRVVRVEWGPPPVLPYALGVASLAILAGLWWVLR